MARTTTTARLPTTRPQGFYGWIITGFLYDWASGYTLALIVFAVAFWIGALVMYWPDRRGPTGWRSVTPKVTSQNGLVQRDGLPECNGT